jgi:hypothetical protein
MDRSFENGDECANVYSSNAVFKMLISNANDSTQGKTNMYLVSLKLFNKASETKEAQMEPRNHIYQNTVNKFLSILYAHLIVQARNSE